MKTDGYGHLINDSGLTTDPTKTPYFVGDESNQRIAFDFLLLGNGEVVLHSLYGRVDTRTKEDFIYSVVAEREALESATNLVSCARSYLQEHGLNKITHNAEFFIEDLATALNQLHN